MSGIDWLILGITINFIVLYGYWKTKNISSVHEYFKGKKNTPWWTVGLGVMATQASAITFMSTPGQAFHDGMGFIQMYLGLPIAMIIICITFIPLYHTLKVYTAYEFLEKRFDAKTRVFTAFLFLLQRGMAAGITIYAPSIILSTVLGWDLHVLNILIGTLVILYTVSGGTQAVNVTQKQQMFVIMGGMFFVFYYLLTNIHSEVDFEKAMQIAGLAGKTEVLDFSINWESRYTFWSGLTGGLFLSLSYFGTDQSQVQRYLSGESIRQSRLGLLFNAIFKIPMQFFILLTGVLVFVFYQYHPTPLFFNQATVEKVKSIDQVSPEWNALEHRMDSLHLIKSNLLSQNTDDSKIALLKVWEEEKKLKDRGFSIIKKALPQAETNDKDYVFISFILGHLPHGFIGLLLAVIFSAAMSSTAAELNALSTTTSIDIYQRFFSKNPSDQHQLMMSKWFTWAWGVIAIGFASVSSLFENLIQLVNIVGSVFYGTILGIFLIAFYLHKIQAKQIFPAAILSEAVVILIFFTVNIGYLWLNAIGCLLVIFLSFIMKISFRKPIQGA